VAEQQKELAKTKAELEQTKSQLFELQTSHEELKLRLSMAEKRSSALEQQLNAARQQLDAAKIVQRGDSTWLPPPVVPVANKPGGTAVGFVGKTGGERWLLKLGMDKTEGHKATASILSKSVAVRGMATDAIKEVVAAAAFKALSRGLFNVPEVRLSVNGVLNWFTRGNPLAVAMLQHINSKRPSSQQLTDAMHIASKFIDGYRDLDALVAVDGAADISMAEFMAKHRRPPTLARVDGCIVPVHGIEAILAAARLVADTDCLGGGFNNAGFVVRRNAIGMPLSVHTVKIDTGFSFNFQGSENIYTKSFSPFATGHKLRDLRDIQFGNNQTFEVEFDKLLPDQKDTFMKTFKHGLQRLDKGFITALIWQDNAFNTNKVRVKQVEVNQAAEEWLAYLSQLAKTYHKELESVSTDVPAAPATGRSSNAASSVGFDAAAPPVLPAAGSSLYRQLSGPPRELLCPLTLQMFEDAVITPYGTTYERTAILTALRHNQEDPLTRQPLTAAQLVPNRVIAEAVERYRKSASDKLSG